MSAAKKTNSADLIGVYAVPLPEVLGVRVLKDEKQKSMTQQLAENGVQKVDGLWVRKGGQTQPSAAAAALTAARMAAAEAIAVYAEGERINNFFAHALTFWKTEQPDWTNNAYDAIMHDWAKFDSQTPLSRSMIAAFRTFDVHQDRIDVGRLREQRMQREAEEDTRARIHLALMEGKVSWVCKCKGYDDDDGEGEGCRFDGPYDCCYPCDAFGPGNGRPGELNTNATPTSEQLQSARERAKTEEAEAKARIARERAEATANPRLHRIPCHGPFRKGTPPHYLHCLDGADSFRTAVRDDAMPAVLRTGIRWLADARYRVFLEGDRVYRWQTLAKAMAEQRVQVLEDDGGDDDEPRVLNLTSSDQTLLEHCKHDDKTDPSEDSVGGPEELRRLILDGDVETMPFPNLKALTVKTTSPSQIRAVAQKFREHYELMKHEHKHAQQLATLLAATVCAARPTDRVLAHVRAVLNGSVPPLDPRCGKTRRLNPFLPHNKFYELFVNYRTGVNRR